MRARDAFVAALGWVIGGAGCSSSTSEPLGVRSPGDAGGATALLQGSVIDKDSNQPLAGSIVIVEVGGLYQTNADTSKGNPFYNISAITAADGSFKVTVPAGQVGLHTFQNGYFYGVLGPIDVRSQPAGNVVHPKALLPLDKRPTSAGFTITPSTVAAGGSVTLSADVHASPDAGSTHDPLSEEVIAAEPSTNWAAVLDPPSPGVQGTGFPDGRYSKTFAAPSKPGTYTYSLVVSSEGCITSDRATTTLTVQ